MSAYEALPHDITFVAAVDMTNAQYQFVKVVANESSNTPQVALCIEPTDQAIGVVQNCPPLGGAAQVRVYGVSFVTLGATLAAPALVGPGTSGAAIAVVAATDWAAGTLLTGGNQGELGSVLLQHIGLGQ